MTSLFRAALLLLLSVSVAAADNGRDMARETEIEATLTKLNPALLAPFREARLAYDKNDYAAAAGLLAPICGQPTAETGVFFGHHNQGAGVSVGLTEGSANLRLRQLNRVLIGEVLEQPRWEPTRERKFSLSWNGSELTIRGTVGGKAWALPPQQIEAEPGVWILALTAGGNPLTIQGKSDALERPVIREFRFSRIRPEPVQF